MMIEKPLFFSCFMKFETLSDQPEAQLKSRTITFVINGLCMLVGRRMMC